MRLTRSALSILVVAGILCMTSCSTSSLSRREITRRAADLAYVTIPAAVAHTDADVRVRYVEAGAPGTPAFVLVHGFASGSFTWNKIMPELASRYHVFAIDMPGFGFSDKPSDFPYGRQGYGEAVLDFMQQKKISSAVLVGNSMGGAICLWLAIYHPERVRRMVLISTYGYPEKPSGMASVMVKPWVKPFAHLLFGKPILKMMLKQVYYDTSRITPELIETYGRPFKTPNAKDALFRVAGSIDLQEDVIEFKKLPGVHIPTLILWGENDAWLQPKHAQAFHHAIANSELIMIPRCGHMPQEEKPEVVLEAIAEFLRNNR